MIFPFSFFAQNFWSKFTIFTTVRTENFEAWGIWPNWATFVATTVQTENFEAW